MSGRLPPDQPAASAFRLVNCAEVNDGALAGTPGLRIQSCAFTCTATPGSSWSRNASNCSVVIEVNEKCLMYFLMKTSNASRPTVCSSSETKRKPFS